MPPKATAAKRTGAKADAPMAGKKAKPEPEPAAEEEEEEDSEDGNDDDEDEADQKPEVRKSASKVETKPSAKDSGASILRKNDKNNMAFPKGTYLIRLADLDTEKRDHIWRVETKPPAKDSGASILRKNDKNNMAFPKGTYLIRLADLDTEKRDHIWRVDNHQLLQKYERQAAQDDSKYQRTNRYTGYFCSEGYKFLELRVLEKENKEEKVRVKYPTKDDLQTAKDKAEAKQKEIEEGEE